MPLAADEVLLYPRRRRYIVSICIGFAGAQIYSCRERIYPFRIYRFSRQFPVGLTQKPYRYNVNSHLKMWRLAPQI